MRCHSENEEAASHPAALSGMECDLGWRITTQPGRLNTQTHALHSGTLTDIRYFTPTVAVQPFCLKHQEAVTDFCTH